MHALVNSEIPPVDSDFDVLSSLRSLNARMPEVPVEVQLVRMAREWGAAPDVVYASSWREIFERTQYPMLSATTAFKIAVNFKSDEVPAEAIMSPLARKLLALRRAAIARGLVLLDEDEVRDEVARRRGELR